MLRDKLSLVPTNPGCYLMKNSNSTIIYVGKAKNLKNRLSSYFNGMHSGKTAKLVSEIVDFEYIITNTEIEALVLELNLIKKYDPYYNILLKDDKTYPHIEITSDKYPRLSIVRNINIKKSKNKLFGPYPNVTAARNTINLLNRLYPLRKCLNMPKKTCLYYHIKECLGYCEYPVPKEKIDVMINDINRFLKGDYSLVKKLLTDKMNQSSENLEFERALEYKELLSYVEITLDRQKVNLNDFINRDIFGYYYDKGYLSIQVFFLRNGILVERDSSIIPLIDTIEEQIITFISTFYDKDNIKPKEILVQDNSYIDLLEEVLKIKVYTPVRGEKKSLLDLAINNAKLSLTKEIDLINKNDSRTFEANLKLGELLNIKNLERIDIFDNSNLFGSFSVSGMVVFVHGKPSKKDYRKYKISVDKNDDYNTMKEVIYRRYFKAVMNKETLPSLIIVDGGLNQINAAVNMLTDLNLNIRVVGLKKDDKHRTSKLISQYEEIDIDKTSDVFHLLTRMQDEVHKYTINYHRQIRSKGNITSILDNIEGIGGTRKKTLLKEYGSVVKLSSATIEDLEKHLPSKVALNLYNYLKEYNNVK